jgi:hypothetical protein
LSFDLENVSPLAVDYSHQIPTLKSNDNAEKKIKKGERARKYIVESSVKKNIKKKIRKEEGAVNRNGWIGREKEI